MRLVTPSLVVKNLTASKDVRVLGAKIKPGHKVDLFKAVAGLTEATIFKAIAAPTGELYVKIAKGELVISSTTLSILENSDEVVEEKHGLTGLAGSVDDVNDSVVVLSNKDVSRLHREYQRVSTDQAQTRLLSALSSALSGDLNLVLGKEEDAYISATVLNDAYRSSVSGSVAAILQTHQALAHAWANFDLAVSVTGTFDDQSIELPTVTSKTLVGGRGLVSVTFDIDGGDTKVYQAGDFIELEIKVASDNKLLGFTVESVTKKFIVS